MATLMLGLLGCPQATQVPEVPAAGLESSSELVADQLPVTERDGPRGDGGDAGDGTIVITPFESVLEDYLQWRVDGQQLVTDSPLPVVNFVEAVAAEMERTDPDVAADVVRSMILGRVKTGGDLRSVFWANQFALGVQRLPDDFEIMVPDAQEKGWELAKANGAIAPDTVVIYVNGINTIHLEAVIDSQVLRSTLSGASSEYRIPGIKSVMFWNYSARSAIEEYFCPALFAEPLHVEQCIKEMNSPLPVGASPLGVLSSQIETPGFFIDLAEAGAQTLLRLFKLDVDASGQVPELVRWIKSAIQRGRRVILIPHSQGNFFVDAALKQIIAEEEQQKSYNIPHWGSDPCEPPYTPYLGVVSTGAPIDLSVLPGIAVRLVQVRGDFLTWFDVIGVPEGNVDPVDPDASGRQLHNFTGSYLRGEARARIAQHVRELRELLPLPGQIRAISASLEAIGDSEAKPDRRGVCNTWSDLKSPGAHGEAFATGRIERDNRSLRIHVEGDLKGTPDPFYPISATYRVRVSATVDLAPGQVLRIRSSGTPHHAGKGIALQYFDVNAEGADTPHYVEFDQTAIVSAEEVLGIEDFLRDADPMRFVQRRRPIHVTAEFVPFLKENESEVTTRLAFELEVELSSQTPVHARGPGGEQVSIKRGRVTHPCGGSVQARTLLDCSNGSPQRSTDVANCNQLPITGEASVDNG